MSREILDCLKREQDICVKSVIPSQNKAFMWIPAKITYARSCSLELTYFVRAFHLETGMGGKEVSCYFAGKEAQKIDRSVDRWAPELLVLTFMTGYRGRFARVDISRTH